MFPPNVTFKQAPGNLPLFGANTNRLLAADTEVGYSLTKLSNSLKNDSIILHSSSEALLLDYIEQQRTLNSVWTFDISHWQTWSICLLNFDLLSTSCPHLYALSQTIHYAWTDCNFDYESWSTYGW